MNTAAVLATTLLALGMAAADAADETTIVLKEAPGRDLVRASCSGCHSLDYLEMNSPFLKRPGWEAEVRKMIKVMGAPLREEDVAPLVEYLTTQYGVE